MAKGKGGFIGQDGLNAPDSPTGVSGSAGDEQVEVSFTAPSDVGGSAITGYRVQSNDGIGASGSSSPITVTGLTNDTAYTFNVWAINAFGYSAPSDASSSVSPTTPRAIVGGGTFTSNPGNLTTIQYVALGTSGNFADFGDLTTASEFCGAVSSSSRAVFASSQDGNTNVLAYVTISTTGNATDFGDAVKNHNGTTRGVSSSTRGLFHSERNPTDSDLIDYITIATTGNAATFGNLSVAREGTTGACSSTTRGVFAGGRSGGTYYDTIDYVTIASTGNATNFGSLAASNLHGAGGLSSGTRGVFSGGEESPYSSATNRIQYITIASTGNTTDFGDLSDNRSFTDSTSNKTIGIIIAGKSSTALNSVDKITIASTGNATDFGDVSTNNFERGGATSAAHGGLS